jgi:hypothetical protein
MVKRTELCSNGLHRTPELNINAVCVYVYICRRRWDGFNANPIEMAENENEGKFPAGDFPFLRYGK